MSDPYLDVGEFDDELTDDEIAVDPFEIAEHIESGLEQIKAELERRQDQEFAILKAQTAEKNAREAFAALDEAHPDWQEHGDAISAGLQRDFANGLSFDPQELAERVETYYLAARERSRPTPAQEAAAQWERVQAIADKKRNPWTR